MRLPSSHHIGEIRVVSHTSFCGVVEFIGAIRDDWLRDEVSPRLRQLIVFWCCSPRPLQPCYPNSARKAVRTSRLCSQTKMVVRRPDTFDTCAARSDRWSRYHSVWHRKSNIHHHTDTQSDHTRSRLGEPTAFRFLWRNPVIEQPSLTRFFAVLPYFVLILVRIIESVNAPTHKVKPLHDKNVVVRQTRRKERPTSKVTCRRKG
jgi:hypothetical protein